MFAVNDQYCRFLSYCRFNNFQSSPSPRKLLSTDKIPSLNLLWKCLSGIELNCLPHKMPGNSHSQYRFGSHRCTSQHSKKLPSPTRLKSDPAVIHCKKQKNCFAVQLIPIINERFWFNFRFQIRSRQFPIYLPEAPTEHPMEKRGLWDKPETRQEQRQQFSLIFPGNKRKERRNKRERKQMKRQMTCLLRWAWTLTTGEERIEDKFQVWICEAEMKHSPPAISAPIRSELEMAMTMTSSSSSSQELEAMSWLWLLRSRCERRNEC